MIRRGTVAGAFAALSAATVAPAQLVGPYAEPTSQGQIQTPDRSGSASFSNAAEAPLHDLNIVRQGIPPVLMSAIADPYAPPSPAACDVLMRDVHELDVALGADFNEPGTPQTPSLTRNNGHLALALVQSAARLLLPYAGLVRTVSGAQRHDQMIIEAITAGSVRRGYLKGLGEAHGCPPPAQPTHRLDGSARQGEDGEGPRYPIH